MTETNITEGPRLRGLVPVLSSVQAGKWREVPEVEITEWLPCPVAHSADGCRVVGVVIGKWVAE